MALTDDIREHAAEMLNFELPLDEFEEWFASSTWNVHRAPDASSAAPLAYKIDLLLSEFSGNYRTEYELRRSIVRLLQDDWGKVTVLETRPRSETFYGASTSLVAALA